jgi:hypothetical protein
VTPDKQPRLKVAPESEERTRFKLKMISKRSRGRSIGQEIEVMKKLPVGWNNYSKPAEVKTMFEAGRVPTPERKT